MPKAKRLTVRHPPSALSEIISRSSQDAASNAYAMASVQSLFSVSRSNLVSAPLWATFVFLCAVFATGIGCTISSEASDQAFKKGETTYLPDAVARVDKLDTYRDFVRSSHRSTRFSLPWRSGNRPKHAHAAVMTQAASSLLEALRLLKQGTDGWIDPGARGWLIPASRFPVLDANGEFMPLSLDTMGDGLTV